MPDRGAGPRVACQFAYRRPRGTGSVTGKGTGHEGHAQLVLSVSNSFSGRHWELDQVPAVGDPTDIVQLGTGHHVSAGEGQRRVGYCQVQ